MSRTNGNSTHGHSCRCRRCISNYLSLTGTGFATNNPQQDVGQGSLTQPPPPSQEQVNQGRRDLEALTNTLGAQQTVNMWADPSRTVFRDGAQPTQYYPPLDMETDITSTYPRQTQTNGPSSTNNTAPTQTNVAQLTLRRLSRSDAPAAQAGGRPQGQVRAGTGSRSNYGTPSAPSGRSYSTNTSNRRSQPSRRVRRQVPSHLSRQSKSVAEDTPETEESSSDDTDES